METVKEVAKEAVMRVVIEAVKEQREVVH